MIYSVEKGYINMWKTILITIAAAIICMGTYMMHHMAMYFTPAINSVLTSEEQALIAEEFELKLNPITSISKIQSLPESYTVQIPFSNVYELYNFIDGSLSFDDSRKTILKDGATLYSEWRMYYKIGGEEIRAFEYGEGEYRVAIYDENNKYYMEIHKRRLKNSVVMWMFENGQKQNDEVIVVDAIGIVTAFAWVIYILRKIMLNRRGI